MVSSVFGVSLRLMRISEVCCRCLHFVVLHFVVEVRVTHGVWGSNCPQVFLWGSGRQKTTSRQRELTPPGIRLTHPAKKTTHSSLACQTPFHTHSATSTWSFQSHSQLSSFVQARIFFDPLPRFQHLIYSSSSMPTGIKDLFKFLQHNCGWQELDMTHSEIH